MEAREILRLSTDLQSRLIRGLSSESSVEEVMAVIVETATKALEASACAILTVDQGRRMASQRAGPGCYEPQTWRHGVKPISPEEPAREPAPGEKIGIDSWILSTGNPFLARTPEELARHPQYRPEGNEVRTFLGVPIRGQEGDVVGLIKAERRLGDGTVPAEPFSGQDELVLETIARVARRCNTYIRLAQRKRQAEAVTAWTRDLITEAASSEWELDSFLNIIAKATAAAMEADSCGIFLKDESGKTLTQRAGFGPSQEIRKGIREYYWPDAASIEKCRDCTQTRCQPPNCPLGVLPREKRVGLTAWIAATGRSFHARSNSELQSHCHHVGLYDKWNFPDPTTECSAFLGVPIRVGETTLGVVKVENKANRGTRETRDFPIEGQQRLEALAQDIALAIVRVQAQIEDRYRIMQEVQQRHFAILRGGLDESALIAKTVQETRELFHADTCALFLKKGNLLVQEPYAAASQTARGREEYSLVPEERIKENPGPGEKVGLTVWIAGTKKKFTARSYMELLMHPHYVGKYGDRRCESFMGFPLVVKESSTPELIGVLKVENKWRLRGEAQEVTYFTELDERIGELIANSAAMAIENARLLATRHKAEMHALQRASAMVTHRLRNVLPVVTCDLSELAKSALGQDAQSSVRSALDLTLRAERIVSEFLTFAKSERFSTPDRVTPPQLVELVKQGVVEVLSPSCGVVETEIATDEPSVRVSMDRLKDDFVALARDSARYRPNGLIVRISVGRASAEDVERAKLPQGIRYLKLVYSDNGPGVCNELKEKIFDPFFTTSGGSGLGLAIAAFNAKVHGGCIIECGQVGRGARFEIYLKEDIHESK
jgi:signal transduction histidine kinase